MANWDMTKTEKITPLFDNNDLKEDVSRLEKKIDTILTLLTKEANNDKTGFKPISGNDSGV